ncbi:hypothetical protein D3C73_546140 [compost metagenome]
MPLATKTRLRLAERRASRTAPSTTSSVARPVQTRAAGLPSVSLRKTTAFSFWPSGASSLT